MDESSISESYESAFLYRGALLLLSDASIFPSVEAAADAFALAVAPNEDITTMTLRGTLADEASIVRRSFTSSETVAVELRFGNLLASLSASSLDGSKVPEQTVLDLIQALSDRVQDGMSTLPVFDWETVAPDAVRPWSILVSAEDLGPAWTETQTVKGEGANVGSKATEARLSAFSAFSGPAGTTVTSNVIVSADIQSAMQETRSWSGVFGARGEFKTPKLGDETSSLALTSEDGQRMEYRIKFRRGSMVHELDAVGSASAPPQADQVVKWAQQADTKLAAALASHLAD